MSLTVYNTLTRNVEPFVPLHEGHVGIYVCGPTVYGDAHIGHAKSYVSFDVIVRYLRFIGYKVLYVQNVTDVGHLLEDGEDRVLRRSRLERIHPMQVAELYTRSFFEDMDAMGVQRPDISPRATGHIPEQLELVRRLVEKGLAYVANGSVYFDVGRFAAYGKLSGRSVDDLVEGTRVEVRSEKRHPADFALWKKAEPEHVLRWPSPWGEGFPGWHLECSAMSMKYLGETFDIHGGGLDNQFPHHECEIAQSEGATGKPFVKYWIHNNLVTENGQKMSKSLNNFVNLKDAYQKFEPLVVRFFVLQSHYRSTLDFSDQALAAAGGGLEKLLNAVRNLRQTLRRHGEPGPRGPSGLSVETYRQRFLEAMDEDFNAPQAIAVLFDLVRELNQILNADQPPDPAYLADVDRFLRDAGGTVLGIVPEDLGVQELAAADLVDPVIRVLIDVRNEARKQKLWSLADLIRDRLKSIGVVLEDKREGTVWRREEAAGKQS